MTEAERERLSRNLAEVIPLQSPSRTTGGARHKRNVPAKSHPHENHQPTRTDPRGHAFTQCPSTGRPNTSLECHPSPAQDLATGRGCKLLIFDAVNVSATSIRSCSTGESSSPSSPAQTCRSSATKFLSCSGRSRN